MWPVLIFAALIALVLLDFWWHSRRLRAQREQAKADFTAQALREHEQLVAETRAQQQALFNSMVEGVLLLDADGRVQLVNDSLRSLLALPDDPRGRALLEAIRWPALQALVSRTAAEGQVQGVELESPGSEPRALHVNATAWLDRDHQPQGTILVFHDITRLKQLENTRRDFVANVSHELRTPLSLIKGFVETLQDGAKNDPATATRFLEKIEKHTDRLAFLIEDLLTVSNLESGQAVLNLHRVALRDAAQRVLDDLQRRAAERSVTLRNEIPAELGANADADRLDQVFSNLLDNAIKYGRNNGAVIVGASPPRDGFVEVFVRDDGPGIPADARERVFERFFRVDKARSREQGGTGLGLAIVKHIVQSHGGTVRVESELDRGSTFFFTLPTA